MLLECKINTQHFVGNSGHDFHPNFIQPSMTALVMNLSHKKKPLEKVTTTMTSTTI